MKTDKSVLLFTADEKNKAGNRHNTHHNGVLIILVAVKLTYLNLTVKLISELLDNRSEHKAGLAPGRPEIHENRHSRFHGYACKLFYGAPLYAGRFVRVCSLRR